MAVNFNPFIHSVVRTNTPVALNSSRKAERDTLGRPYEEQPPRNLGFFIRTIVFQFHRGIYELKQSLMDRLNELKTRETQENQQRPLILIDHGGPRKEK